MSIIREKEISLQQLIERSDLILEVEFVEDYVEEITADDEAGAANVPPFRKKGCVYRTGHVLKNTQNIQVPELINVPDENWRRFFSQYKERYFNGPSKSYGVDEYASDVPSMQQATVLFLEHFKGTYELVARDAFESKTASKKIGRMLKGK